MIVYDIVRMLDLLQEFVYSDKIFENNVLGKVSCASFSDTLRECKRINKFADISVDPCVELRQVTDHCYKSKDVK